MPKFRLVAFVFLVFCQASSIEARDCAREPPLAFVDVALVKPETGQIEHGRSVIVVCGTITAVGPAEDLKVPRRAIVISGAGRFLVPGLVDAHMHLKKDPSDLKLYLAQGITSVRSLDGVPDHVAWRAMVRTGELQGPSIYTSGPILYGWEEEWKKNSDVRAVARGIVAEHLAVGYDYLKVYFQLSIQQYEALVEAAAAARLPVVGHTPRAVGLERVFRAGQQTVEHLTGYDDLLERKDEPVTGLGSAWLEMRRTAHADERQIPDAARRTAAARTWNVPTLIVYEIWTRPNEIASIVNDEATMALLTAETKAEWAKYNKYQISKLDDQSPADREILKTAVRIRKSIVKAIVDAGGGIAAGTDAPARFVVPGLSLHQELALLVEAGLTPAQALAAATINGARALGHEGEFGRILPGYRADLVLVKGNPFDDLAVVRRPEGVLAAGRWYPRPKLEAMLQDVRKAHRAERPVDAGPGPGSQR